MALRTEELEKDHYRVLGVPETATDQEITRAYRRLARELHPDTGSGDNARFGDVATAYEVLHDPARRREYDQARRLLRAGAPPGGSAHTGSAWPRGRTVRVHRRRSPRRGPDLEAELRLDFADAVRGTTAEIPAVEEVRCPGCDGTGRDPRALTAPCSSCAGTGVQRRSRTVTARIPAGVDDGQAIRLPGRGGAGIDGGPPGDLWVRVHVAPHPVLGRRGRDLTVSVPVTFAEAALGADVRVPTLDGPVTVRVPAGTQPGTTLRLRGSGVPGPGTPGDLLVTVRVEVPRQLTPRQRAAVEELAAATPDPPREGPGS